MENELLEPVLQYGIIRERMAALFTDALRARILECCGYRVQILEFIDMEHTPKNLLIRAVKQGGPRKDREELQAVLDFLHAEPTLYRLLMEQDDYIYIMTGDRVNSFFMGRPVFNSAARR